MLRPIRLATVGTCLLLALGVVAASSAAGAGTGTAARPWMDRSLNDADRAAVDRVCGSIGRCVVVVVSGRPLILTDQLGQMDALVADPGAGADQRRRPPLPPPVPLRLRAAHLTAHRETVNGSRLRGTPARSVSPTR